MDCSIIRSSLIRSHRDTGLADRLCIIIGSLSIMCSIVIALPLHELNNTQSKPNDILSLTSHTELNKNSIPPRIAADVDHVYTDKCQRKRSCRAIIKSRALDSEPKKQSCACDQACKSYDDCCADSKFASSVEQRKNELNLKIIRSQWFCHHTGPFGDVYIKASCSPEWLTKNLPDVDSVTPTNTNAKIVKENCEHIRVSNEKSFARSRAETGESINSQSTTVPQLDDPLGMMMHITDIVSGITYANSYCLQCNPINLNQSKLIYWSPVIDCNYDVTKDDRNNLLDLVHSSRGKALKYSKSLQSWFIEVPNSNRTALSDSTESTHAKIFLSNDKGSNETVSNHDNPTTSDRICKFEPVIPNSVEHMIRFCRANVVDKCISNQLNVSTLKKNQSVIKDNANGNYSVVTNQTLIDECHLGYQALVYSQTSDIAYRNLACAHCNNEFNVHCEPKMRKNLPDDNLARRLSPDINPFGYSYSAQGSFSVLFDIYNPSPDDQQVGVIHQCGSNEEIYDPIFSSCRHVICGLNRRFHHGECVANQLDLDENRSDTVKTVSNSTVNAHKTYVGETSTDDEKKSVHINESTAKPDVSKLPKSIEYTTTMRADTEEGIEESIESSITSTRATTSTSDDTTESNTEVPTVVSSTQASDSAEFTNHHNREDSLHTLKKDRQIRIIDATRSTENVTRYNVSTNINGNTARNIDNSKPFVVMDTNLTAIPNVDSLTSEQKTTRSEQRLDHGTKNLTSSTAEAIVNTRPSFKECGKIYISKSQYKLTNLITPKGNVTIAHVKLYNLTLEPDQYTLDLGEEHNLLICTPFKSDLAPKFKPLMGMITTIGLVISITSLTLFLLLYISSSCVSCAGNYRKGSVGSASHNSLSSRGIVCLSTSLLAAYVLFLSGQQLDTINQNEACVFVAVSTYFCFLMSFNWMFLLSFDVWRTLRLATCHLRGPIIHAQSKRFLIYMIYSLAISTAIVAAAIYVDLQPKSLSSDHQPNQGHDSSFGQLTRDTTTLDDSKLKQIYDAIIHGIINDYRPRFGQRQGSCWFANRRGLALFFGLPVTLIMIINLLFFIHSSIMVIMTSTKSSRGQPYDKKGDLISSIDESSRKKSSSNKRFELKRNRTISSFSLTSASSVTTLDYNVSGERLKSIPSGLGEDLPAVIIESDETSETASEHQNKHGFASKLKLFLIEFLKQPRVVKFDQHISKQCKENEGICVIDSKLGTFDNNLTIQSTITNMAHNMSDSNINMRDVEQETTKEAPNNNALDSSTPHSINSISTNNEQTKSKDPDKYDASKKRGSITVSNSSTLPLVEEKSSTEKAAVPKQSVNSRSGMPIQQQLSIVLASVSKDFRLYWRLSTIMGLTWLTGIVASFADSDILWYLFVILNTLQGLFIFIAFGCKKSKLSSLEPILRRLGLYKILFKKR